MNRHHGSSAAVMLIAAVILGVSLAIGVVAQTGVGALFPGAELEPPDWVTPGNSH